MTDARGARKPQTCHERALGLLAVRARSRRELERRLVQAGFGATEVEDVLTRLEGVGLIDDEAFAEQVAQHAFGVKRSGRRAVASALAAKGVSPDLIDEVIERTAGDDEERAFELARGRAERLRSVDPARAFARLVSLLVRRGYGSETARTVARRALLPDAPDPSLASRSPGP